ncbi:hypothetical protein E2P86_08595 [Sphingobacterium psychroaquaticum]|uniref:hypothetical protein n=1 Tax=Sphingobacterium psychroaquaticum TaxID=561061 RepID=UPI001069CF70|nr:hypothetical protein [Sphingobacterium psychroaquaticum]QBQ41212.1 hypothetical protein E2P86_08595 [Sphingobacterium psychroaquaticum]
MKKIDELTIYDHAYLTVNDNCYYFAEYPSGDPQVNRNNPIYSLIHNLKKTVDRKESPEWKYKLIAIEQCQVELVNLFQHTQDIGEYTLVPIPPSKTKRNEMYDDRTLQILIGLKLTFDNCDVRELIYTIEDRVPSHHSTEGPRPTIEEIYQNYQIDETQTNNIRRKIILVDDVLTKGTHYQAAKRIITERFPGIEIRGLFIARRVSS